MMPHTELLVFANWSTLLVCMVLKFPQILSIMRAGSTEGLSLGSVLLEVTGFLVFLRYQMYYEYPMETYLEYPILIAQDVVLLLFIFYYTGSMQNALAYSGIFFALWNVLILQKWIIDLALNLCTVISASSKFLQLQHLWRAKDSGQASALTWAMATYTSAILLRFIVMLILNLWVTLVIVKYRKKEDQKDAKKRD
ncbi:PREDICTED: PQ-loop repeat-containing protein 3 isoform X2 [Nanorana parkeri]|uniref:PQ-loop repeat-containing protein 3 isoform X2 n=1 Tax=Nanorana parkeri TaxID=125878 RepID=UPI0008550818|nr:PREDICTED: PQ-loop repeat-containing protein 3 isoform X2 [Nanorana parkeri]